MPILSEKFTVSVSAVSPNYFNVSFPALGCKCQMLYESDSLVSATEFYREVCHWLTSFESRYSRYNADSLICTINRNAGNNWLGIDAEADSIFELCDRAFSISQGYFDPSALPLIHLWDYMSARSSIPELDEIKQALSHVNWNRIVREKGRIQLPQKGMGIDIGGIGKEYSVDMVMKMALEHDIDNIMVEFGQDIHVHGIPPEGGVWRIGLEDPLNPGSCWTGIALTGGAIATSGDYQRNFVLGGKRYGHIIDPKSGYPVSNSSRSVTVIAPACVTAGVLSTSAFILGADLGLGLIEEHEEAEGCIVTEDGLLATTNFSRFVLEGSVRRA
jgi:thiamine biosynthesis lipoprotein